MKQRGKYVIDSFSIISYCEGIKNSVKVSDIFKSALNNEIEIYTSVITYGDILSLIHKHADSVKVALFIKTFEQLPIKVINITKEQVEEAAKLKAENKLGFAESYTAALAISENACLITGEKLLGSLKNKIDILFI
ncbi:MAG: PIN domain-containing protein [Melioribacteraceae bacterium]|nr:PIN domain-containing protein [Melioribacteraceae bacterium]